MYIYVLRVEKITQLLQTLRYTFYEKRGEKLYLIVFEIEFVL